MSKFKSDFLRTLDERGFLHQGTDLEGLDELAASGEVIGYIGFDCTAPSLHAGSLVQIMLLRHLQRSGHRPIVLLGGGTTKVGDPTDKDKSRPLLSEQEIADNMAGIRRVFEKFLDFDNSDHPALMVNNADWLDALGYVQFLREYGTHFTINRMLTFDSVKLRLEREQPMTFLEFNYMLMQACDFHELYKRYNCRLQMGGSDQWGNIVNGVELCRRLDGVEVFGLTTPLLTTASGAKMGKTAEGAVWLNADMRSPYDYWQYWRNTEDPDVGRFLRLFTELPLDEIRRLEALRGAEINDAKKILATEATAMLHGRAAAEAAADTARKTFEEGSTAGDLPSITVPLKELQQGIPVITLFRSANLGASNSEIRRHIKGGGARINDQPISDEKAVVTDRALGPDKVIKLSIGKKKHVLVRTS